MLDFVVPLVCRAEQSADIVSAWKQQQTAVLIKLDNNLASQDRTALVWILTSPSSDPN